MVHFYAWCVKIVKFNTLAGLGFVGQFMYIYIYIYMSGEWLQKNIIDVFNQEHTPMLSRAVVFGS